MTAEVSPCTPEEFWGDDETPATGHRAADVSDPDARRPLEDTATYLRRLSTELNQARADRCDDLDVHWRYAETLEDLAEARDALSKSRADAIRAWRERDEQAAEVARLTPKPGCRVCGRTDCATT